MMEKKKITCLMLNTKSGIPTVQGGDRRDAETKLGYNPKCKFAVLSCLYSQRENKKVYIWFTKDKFHYTYAKKYYSLLWACNMNLTIWII